MMPPDFFDGLKRDLKVVESRCVFTLPVTIWLMVLQRLSPLGTLESAVEQLRQGSGRELLTDCKRVREGRISAHTGAYGQARVNLPVAAARRVAEQTFRSLSRGPANTLRDRMFVLDGSTIRLAHSAALAESYPPARNPRRPSHWPILLITVLHHVRTGIAMAPAFGPAHGSAAVSEQSLAEELIDQLPPSSVLIGDRNFGIFAVLWHAYRQGHQVLTRLTADRARRIGGGAVPESGRDIEVVWKPSGHDRRAHPEIPADACMKGRLAAVKPAGAREVLYLFTTLDQPPEELASLYCERWTIETDLRSLKEQVRLHRIEAKSPGMVACELFLAVATWNLIRAVMQQAARQANIEVRRLSFSRARAALLALAQTNSHRSFQQQDSAWQLVLQSIAQCKLPNRRRPSTPRLVWPRSQPFAKRKVVLAHE
jgi:putative transposase